MNSPITWPNGSRIAFTICDDTDYGDLATFKYLYRYLADHGVRSTKLTWVQEPVGGGLCGGVTCANESYVRWLRVIQAQGFEIGLHNVSYGSSERQEILRGLNEYREMFGSDPSVHCNHTGCADNLYWGSARLTGVRRMMYALRQWNNVDNESHGHIETSPYFWGDYAFERISFVRGFTFDTLNLFDVTDNIVYHDPLRPYVRRWFIATNGASPYRMEKVFTERALEEFVSRGGLCILYTHLCAGFYEGRHLNTVLQRTVSAMERAGAYMQPVSTILNALHAMRGEYEIPTMKRAILEWKWLAQKVNKKMGI